MSKNELTISKNAWGFRGVLTPKGYGLTEEAVFEQYARSSHSPANVTFAKFRSACVARLFREKIGRDFVYAKIAHEIGDGGLHHIQGYCVFFTPEELSEPRKVRGSVLKKLLHDDYGLCEAVEVFHRKGTHPEMRDYVGNEEKSGSVVWCFAFGDESGLGQGSHEARKDKEKDESYAVLNDILEGANKREIWLHHWGFMCRNFRGVYEGASIVKGGDWALRGDDIPGVVARDSQDVKNQKIYQQYRN